LWGVRVATRAMPGHDSIGKTNRSIPRPSTRAYLTLPIETLYEVALVLSS